MADVAVARVILVIDDDANVRRSVWHVLKFAGWDVEQAVDGEAGLRLIEQRFQSRSRRCGWRIGFSCSRAASELACA